MGESGIRNLRNIRSAKNFFAALLPFKQRRIRSNRRVCKTQSLRKLVLNYKGSDFRETTSKPTDSKQSKQGFLVGSNQRL